MYFTRTRGNSPVVAHIIDKDKILSAVVEMDFWDGPEFVLAYNYDTRTGTWEKSTFGATSITEAIENFDKRHEIKYFFTL